MVSLIDWLFCSLGSAWMRRIQRWFTDLILPGNLSWILAQDTNSGQMDDPPWAICGHTDGYLNVNCRASAGFHEGIRGFFVAKLGFPANNEPSESRGFSGFPWDKLGTKKSCVVEMITSESKRGETKGGMQ